MARNGYAATTVDDIAMESGVSRKALYTHFSGKEDVLLQAHKAVVERIVTGAGPAIDEQDNWKSATRALLDWALEFFAREPAFAHLALIEMAAATPASRQLLRQTLSSARTLVDRAVGEGARALSDRAVQGMLGGVVFVIANAADEGPPSALPRLRPELMAWVSLMLEGPEAAERELADDLRPVE